MDNTFSGPLFIVGLSRSGTKLIRDLINRNDFVSIPEGESHFLPKLLKKNLTVEKAHKYIADSLFIKRYKYVTFPTLDKLKEINPIKTVEELIESVLKFYALNGSIDWSNEVIWGDKTPLYLRSIDILKKHFPNSKVIHIIRDPRDRAISVKRTWGKSMYRTTEKWRSELENSQKWREHKDFLFEIKYEDLISDTEAELKEVCSFIGIPFQDKMLQLNKPSEKHGDNSNKLTVNSKNTDKYLDFKSSVIKRIEEIAYPMMKEYGYVPVYGKKSKPFSPVMMEVLKYSDFIHFKVSNQIKGYNKS